MSATRFYLGQSVAVLILGKYRKGRITRVWPEHNLYDVYIIEYETVMEALSHRLIEAE